MFTVGHILQYLENTIFDKNVKKNARCMPNILEYFLLKPGSLKILPPPPPKKKQRWSRNIFAPD